jgi:hypothetical protein
MGNKLTMNFKTLAASALITITAVGGSAPSAQAFGFGDALNIVNTVVNTVEAVESAGRSSAPAAPVRVEETRNTWQEDAAASGLSPEEIAIIENASNPETYSAPTSSDSSWTAADDAAFGTNFTGTNNTMAADAAVTRADMMAFCSARGGVKIFNVTSLSFNCQYPAGNGTMFPRSQVRQWLAN